MTDGLKDRHREAIIATIAAYDRVERAVLFGSRATGTHSVSSDVDIALIGDRLTMTDQARLAAALDEIPMAQEIDLVLYDSIQDETLRKHIRYQSVEWYAKPIHGEANRGTSGDASTWSIMSLRQAGVSLIDCEHRTPPATNDGYPYVGIPQIKNGRVDLDSARPIAEEHFRDWTRKANPQPFDIILSRRCNPGETGFVSPGLGEFAVGQNLVLLRSDGDKIIKPFLRWLSRGPEWWAQVEKYINAGAVFDSLTCAEIPEFRLPIPPLSDQHAIAHILGTLDDKIELNRRMNATLEAMARALFKSWFVDFDPVRAKIEGRDTGLPKDIGDLFPDRLLDSELGEIPDGWKVAALGDMLELAYGKALKAENRRHDGTVPVYGSRGQIGWHDTRLVQGPGIVVGRKGNPGIVTWVPGDFFPIDTTFYVVSIGGSRVLYFLLYALQGQDLPAVDTDSAVPGLNRNIAYMNLQIVPAEEVVEQFGISVGRIFARRNRLSAESMVLASLRDALLPRLMSGQIGVTDVREGRARH